MNAQSIIRKNQLKTVNEADLIKLEQQFNRKVVLEVRQRILVLQSNSLTITSLLDVR